MNIVFTVDSMNGGGAERVVSTIANELDKIGHKVTIIMVSHNESFSFYLLNKTIVLIPLLRGFKKKPKFFKRVKILKDVISSISPDVIISFLPRIITYTYFSCRKLGIPLIVSERNDPKKYPYLLRMLQKYIFKKADFCVFQTDKVMKWYGKTAAKHSAVVLNPTSLTFYPNFSKINREKTIITVGRLEKQKNHKVLLLAFSYFSKKHPDYVLKIYGDGSLRNELIDFSKILNISKKVVFLGADPFWHEKEFCAGVFVLSSDYEGLPNSLMEAMCLRIPCVSTNCPVGGPESLIKDAENGYLVEVNNAKALCEGIIKAISNPKFDSKLLEITSPSSIAEEWLKIINRIVK